MTRTNLSAIIDELGQIKAAKAAIEARENVAKKALADLEPGSYEGELFRLTITAPEREQLSDELKGRIKDVVNAFRATLSRQYLAAHAPTVATRTLTVRARTGEDVK